MLLLPRLPLQGQRPRRHRWSADTTPNTTTRRIARVPEGWISSEILVARMQPPVILVVLVVVVILVVEVAAESRIWRILWE